jgi:hypothetical protein
MANEPKQSAWQKLREENQMLKRMIRVQALGMLAMVDGFDEGLRMAIQDGARISYEVKGTMELKQSGEDSNDKR